MRFQERDGEILRAIYENEGVLAKRHIWQLYWKNAGVRAMEKRLAKLHDAEYIAWPDPEQRRYFPIPEPVCWLGWKGASYMAGALGLSVQPPEQSKETRLREFHKELRKSGLRWVRQPRWSLLRHDLAVIDFKLAVLEAASHPDFTATSWLPESHFRADIDVVSYQFRTRQGRFKNYKKGVCPDAYFEIVVEDRRKTGLQSRAPFLLEMDMATHDNLSFAREKVIPGANYIKSRKYLSRFGTNSGTWLIVTSGNNRRLENLKKQVRENADENVRMFFITSVEHLRSANPLTDPIWFLANNKEPFSLFEGHPRESE